MLTFLSGLLNVILAAGISLTLVASLVPLFLGLTAGWRRTGWRTGLLLVVFLGMFSYGGVIWMEIKNTPQTNTITSSKPSVCWWSVSNRVTGAHDNYQVGYVD